MFEPKFTISNRLLSQIKRVAKLGADLNQRPFPKLVMINLAKSAREISSFASTSIEGNPLPLTEVKKILKNKPRFARDSEKEVLNYNQALKWLNKQLDIGRLKFNLTLILNIQKQVTNNLLPKNQSGHFRKLPVNDVRPLMQELIDFINQHQKTIDPLILAGIFHKQMVLIHPFMDGNGRTARLATKALLANLGLDTFHLFSFENYYNQNVSRYFDIVGDKGNYYEIVDKIDFTGWLEYFTEGIIDELLRISKLLPQVNLTPESQLASHHDKIIAYLNTHQFITDKDYAKMVDRAKATRALDWKKLIKLNIIERRGRGRSTYYTLKEKK